MTEALAALGAAEPRAEWRGLAERRGNPFITPEWVECWHRHQGRGARLVLAPLVGADGLRGILPLALAGSGRPRTVRVAGSALADVVHPACEPEDELEVAAAAGEALAALDEPWSAIALDRAELSRPWAAALGEASGRRLRTLDRSGGELPQIELGRHAGWEEYLASRASSLRKKVGNLTRRAERDHGMTVRRTEREGEVAADMAILFDLHARRFGGASSISEDARAFHLEFAAAAHERGWLRLWLLELDGRPAAAWYGWRLGDRYVFFNGGFDPDLGARSPGFVLLAKVIESAFEERASVFDFLIGGEDYKHRYADSSRQVRNTVLARPLPHPAAAVVRAEHAGRDLGRRLPGPLRRRLGGLADRSALKGATR